MTRASARARRHGADAAASSLDWLAPLAAKMAGVGYWHYDAVQDRMTWSDEAYRIYGLDPADGLPTLAALDTYCHPDDRAKLDEHRRKNSGKDAEVEIRIVRPDGEVRHVIAKSTVECDETGRVLVRYGTLADGPHDADLDLPGLAAVQPSVVIQFGPVVGMDAVVERRQRGRAVRRIQAVDPVGLVRPGHPAPDGVIMPVADAGHPRGQRGQPVEAAGRGLGPAAAWSSGSPCHPGLSSPA